MAALPTIKLNVRGNMTMPPDDGALEYKYAPFYNLKMEFPVNNRDLTGLTLKAKKAEIAIDRPIDIDIERSYDGSANLIINDRVNPLKIINSRFFLIDSTHYRIGDRKGNLDTNIYTEEHFKVETNLVKSVQSVIGLEFTGLTEGGKMPVGNYTFYFKLSDSDGNESDFISESGRVVCHIGNINQPHFIRGGQINEDSGKSVRFKLKNLDLAYSYINVYYTRNSGDGEQEMITAHKIEDRFKITSLDTDITITGYEQISDSSLDDINVRYSEFTAVKSAENCQNMTFAGGISNNYDIYKTLEQYSLFITPEVASSTEDIGSLDHTYRERYNNKDGYEYFNVKNIYSKLGYWDEEIYRLGIVYIMNDYTLSPVFNIRGIKELTDTHVFNLPTNLEGVLNTQENYVIENTDGLENSKGVFKIATTEATNVFNGRSGIKPIGIKLKFHSDIVDGKGAFPGLDKITRGFFVVRQNRIPTILAQALGAASSKHGNLPTVKLKDDYIMESFLSKDSNSNPKLGSSLFKLKEDSVVKNVLLCPEADLRTEVYNNYFNSSEYVLKKSKYQPFHDIDNPLSFKRSYFADNHLYLSDLLRDNTTAPSIKTSLLLVEPGIELIKNNANKFSSKSGDAAEAHKNIDVKYGDYSDPSNSISDLDAFNKSTSKVRGLFNTYIGSDYDSLEECTYYNIHQKGYDFNNWEDYFKLRYNDSSPFYPISDRMTYEDIIRDPLKQPETPILYRGDCYINTFTHRMNWNFIDPGLPTNTRIIDKYSWYKNYRVTDKFSTVIKTNGNTETLSYNKLLPVFTYKKGFHAAFGGEKDEKIPDGIKDPEDKGFKKYSERNGLFGYDKLSRPDVNAVGLGHWVTYKICSNVNLAMRDVDITRPSEEAVHGMKRSFYPLQSIEKQLNLPESRILNKGISKTVGNKYYIALPDVPFIKTDFPNRIFYSKLLQQSSFVNGNRTFLEKNYQDYTSEYGALIKLVEWYGTLMAVMEHGILQIPVNERAMMKNESGENIYINTDQVLPANPKVLSNTFGSLWADSVIATSKYVYGIDTVGKKIWRTNGEAFEIISDLKIQQFLNDNIALKESDILETVGKYVVKTHYNAFKQDIMFTFKYAQQKWHLCWNELLEKWVTRYSWYPEFSENINNIFYTFANIEEHKKSQGKLYKHGFAGTLAEEGKILPTNWYDEQHGFEFEFIVTPQPGMQKIYDTFEIISNKVEPNSFIFEIVGDGYDWEHLKQTILQLNKGTKSESGAFNYGFNFLIK